MSHMSHGAIVLGGGGVAGIAWEIGVLHGIREAAPHAIDRILDESTRFVGTSAGAAVAAQVAGGTDLGTLLAAQLADNSGEIAADLDLESFGATMQEAIAEANSPLQARQLLGKMAADADTVPPTHRRSAIAARLPVQSWPGRRLLITAIDIETGELETFDGTTGVDLVDAVASSCAVPGIWPVVQIGGRRYMDGGMRTVAIADLAEGCDPVLIVVPSTEEGQWGPAIGADEFAALGQAHVLTVYADEASASAIGANPLDPATRKPAAHAGQTVGRRVAGEVADLWGSRGI